MMITRVYARKEPCMTDDFDPYRDWLNIATPQRPPNHYALLGLSELESNAAKVAAAADERMREVRSHQVGPRGKFTQKLLNELSVAKLCLLDPRAKATYDAALTAQRPAAAPVFAAPCVPSPPSSPPPPVAAPPVGGKIAAPPKPHRSMADEIERSRGGSNLWWVPLAALFLCVIAAASGGMYLYSQRPVTNSPDHPQEDRKTPEVEPEPELVIEQEGSGDLNLPLAVADLTGGVASAQTGGETHLANWNADDAAARWKFKLVRPAVFQLRLRYEASRAGGARFQFRVGNETKTRDISNGAITDEFFWRITRGGRQELELSVLDLPQDGKIELQGLKFIYQGGMRQ
jgi:hypothetical protein